jgi:hypothetical protein
MWPCAARLWTVCQARGPSVPRAASDSRRADLPTPTSVCSASRRATRSTTKLGDPSVGIPSPNPSAFCSWPPLSSSDVPAVRSQRVLDDQSFRASLPLGLLLQPGPYFASEAHMNVDRVVRPRRPAAFLLPSTIHVQETSRLGAVASTHLFAPAASGG